MLGYIKLLRPPLLILGFLASFTIMLHYGNWGGVIGWLILAAVGFGNAAFNIFNEIKDIDTDSIIKPHKPIPSGEVSISTALYSAALFYLLSLASTTMLVLYGDWQRALIAICGYIGGTIYNMNRRRDLVGNFALGMTYFSAAYMSSYPHGLLFALSFALFTSGFNIVVQMQDMAGDALANIRTVPIQIGPYYAKLLSIVILIGSLILFAFSDVSSTLEALAFFATAVLLTIVGLATSKHELYVRKLARLMLIVFFISIGLKEVM